MSLPGVGAATADRIIGGRPWPNVNALVDKNVIKEALLSELKSKITL